MKRAWPLGLALACVAACAAAPRPRAVTAPPRPTPVPAEAELVSVAEPVVESEAPPPRPAATPPPAPLPVPAPASPLEPPLIRVLVGRGPSPALLPQPGRVYRATWGGGSARPVGPLRATAAAAGSDAAYQVGAYRSAEGAATIVARLRRALGSAAVVGTEPGGSLTRVTVRWVEAEPADPAAELARLGFPEAFRVSQPAGAGVRLAAAAGEPVVAAGEVLLEPEGDYPTAAGDGTYRGRFRLRAVGRELLLVNELNLEAYLRGVVPAEMGPQAFPELEALKAQAVAARTYAVAHLGDGAAEGYDLCATVACQVYSGVGVEHPLSDRAVLETAGVIAVFGGAPIDAMFSSTCGGHTEDAALLFPDRAQPYLVGVPCAWERPLELVGRGPGGEWQGEAELAAELARAALGLDPAAADPRAVLAAVATTAGRPAPELAADAGADGWCAALLAAAGLEESAATLTDGAGAVERVVALADLLEVALEPPTGAWSDGWHLRAALAALELRGAVSRDRGEAVPRPDGVGMYPRKASSAETLPSPLELWERRGGAVRRVAGAEALPGETLERVRLGERVLALLVVRSGGGGEADRRSAWRSWARERTLAELAERLGVADLERLEVTARAPSGRVVGLDAVGASGQRKAFAGFPIRRALDLPENLFAFFPVSRPDGTRAIRFLGRGWGHGVGLCQNGAYGLARAGMRYEQILATYYRGVELARWPP